MTLQVQRGERLALLGANGCGMSTLLKVLDGLIFPAGGRYTAFGQPVACRGAGLCGQLWPAGPRAARW